MNLYDYEKPAFVPIKAECNPLKFVQMLPMHSLGLVFLNKAIKPHV